MDNRCKRLVQLAQTKYFPDVQGVTEDETPKSNFDEDYYSSDLVTSDNPNFQTMTKDDETPKSNMDEEFYSGNLVTPNNLDLQTEKHDESVENDQKIIETCRHRSVSTSSSSSSSSDSSSSSSSSFIEDSDDSVKDPDYIEETQQKKRAVFSLTEVTVNSPIAVSSPQTVNEEERSHVEYVITGNENSIAAPETIENDSLQIDPSVAVMESENPTHTLESPAKKGKKRPRQENKWKKNIAKKLRNSGQPYKSAKSQKDIPERRLKPPCKENCRFKCQANITEIQREQLLKEYWGLGEIERQWTFIIHSMEKVTPLQRYVKINPDGTIAPKRDNNNAFFFTLSGVKIRVCKTFFKNTLDINNRPIETALMKKNKNTNISLIKDNRGCHNNHTQVDKTIKTGVRAFIEAIPKIESHYIRANSKRHYIDGSKTISDIHRDYVEHCKAQNIDYANYVMFYRIFNQEYNISFFIPKKDACELCESYKLSIDEEKENKKEKYLSHLEEKRMSRIEKEKDKKNKDIFVAVFDLQAVFQCPKGDTSVFYYKSKLNVLNLTIYDLKSNSVESYVWDESQAHRGVNEIATCVFKYLKKISDGQNAMDVVFYSDNCAGQQKNKFMFAMYLYAVQNLPNINSVTHKFLIKGHTQNEGDSAHSQIERQVKRQLRSGPIYTPEGFIGAIKAARKKSEPIHVNELCYNDIYDWKAVLNQMNFAIHKDEDLNIIKTSEIKGVRMQKDDPYGIYYCTSYADEMKRAVVIKKKTANQIQLKKAFNRKPGLAEKKKDDLLSLVNGNHVPGYYRPFFENL